MNLKPAWTYIGRPCLKTQKAGHLTTQWLNVCLALCKVLSSKRRNTTKANTCGALCAVWLARPDEEAMWTGRSPRILWEERKPVSQVSQASATPVKAVGK